MTASRRNFTPKTVERLTLAAEPWLSCDDCFAQIDAYIELLLADAPHANPGLRAHLSGCSACYEEARSLLLLAAEDDGVDPDGALRRLDAV
ncbi:hypothetical protein ACQCSX_11880 [Pseudarthrobacter sp. P1]|uniref:hypothetical protein n=1 Tax=Pseudarthrobacter sp. P1 TaxID=3418418 RepID=UPI003CF27377